MFDWVGRRDYSTLCLHSLESMETECRRLLRHTLDTLDTMETQSRQCVSIERVSIETLESQCLHRDYGDRGSPLYGDTLETECLHRDYGDTETTDTWRQRVCTLWRHSNRNKPPPPGAFHIYYVPSSRSVCKRTPLEGFVPGSSRGVLLHTVLDEGR